MKIDPIEMRDVMKSVEVTVTVRTGWRFKLGILILRLCSRLIGWSLVEKREAQV